MNAKDIMEMREHGQLEDAYACVRQLYAKDKGAETSRAMFWTAVDILHKRVEQGKNDEARKILMALERMMPNVSLHDGKEQRALDKCRNYVEESLRSCSDGHLRTGAWGEELAAAYLRNKGYIIVDRDWRSKHRDIDIIARTGDCIVFVEVKTRKSDDYGDPAMAVDRRKRRNLLFAINHYIRFHHINSPYRFDIITVLGTPDAPNPTVNHYENVPIR